MQDQFQGRKYVIQGIFIVSAVILLLKCIQLQLIDTSLRDQATANVIQKINLYPSRGLIYDRDTSLLVYNMAIYDLMVTYNEVKDIDTTKFCKLLGITKETFVKNLEKDFKNDNQFTKTKPFVFLKKISTETYARFQESLYEFPGFYVQLRNVRGYNFNSGSHVLGYIGEVDKELLERKAYYQRGDYIGITGLELAYEEYLRGVRGVEYLLRDNLGRIVGRYENGNRDTASFSGKDLITSLDIDLQLYGEKLLQNKRGGIVAIEPATGEILAMVSMPSYDPNLLTINRNRGEEYMKLARDTLKPLFNRAIGAQYPPGSIFKPVMGLIALQEGVTEPFRAIGCRGGYIYKSLRVDCHGHPTAGSVRQAIQHSCNAYFCQIFRDVVDKNGFSKASMGLDIWVNHLYDFGLGKKLGSDVPNELTGNVPTSAYYDKIYRKGTWVSPYIVSLGIGQGELLITPLQMANISVIIANRGYYYPPHLLKAFRDDTTQIPYHLRTPRYTRIDTSHYRHVVNGMEDVVTGGTARIAQIPGIAVCGKTGTAENPHGEDHSVFIAFAPKENPKIAIAVFVENGGFGARYAAPISSLMIEKYLNGKISTERQYLEDKMVEADLNKRFRKKMPKTKTETTSEPID
jgi:penicillin-binding protein 2